jgi:hypothetical protein
MEKLNRALLIATLIALFFLAFGVVVNKGLRLSESQCCDGPCWDPNE